jgi:hypothetical protein
MFLVGGNLDPKVKRSASLLLHPCRCAGTRLGQASLGLLLVAALAACSQPTTSSSPSESPATSTPAPTVVATQAAPLGAPPLLVPTAAAASPAAPVTALTQQQLDQAALSVGDLPAGFAITASGPGGPELGPDVLTSYQEEFQQRDITSAQSLQQTIVVIDLLGQYKDANSAIGGLRAINTQSLNQLLGGVNLTATPVTIPAVGEDSQAFHVTGAANGVSIGGYLIAFHRGPVAAMLLTAGVQGAESLDQSVSLAQKQAQKLTSLG